MEDQLVSINFAKQKYGYLGKGIYYIYRNFCRKYGGHDALVNMSVNEIDEICQRSQNALQAFDLTNTPNTAVLWSRRNDIAEFNKRFTALYGKELQQDWRYFKVLWDHGHTTLLHTIEPNLKALKTTLADLGYPDDEYHNKRLFRILHACALF